MPTAGAFHPHCASRRLSSQALTCLQNPTQIPLLSRTSASQVHLALGCHSLGWALGLDQSPGCLLLIVHVCWGYRCPHTALCWGYRCPHAALCWASAPTWLSPQSIPSLWCSLPLASILSLTLGGARELLTLPSPKPRLELQCADGHSRPSTLCGIDRAVPVPVTVRTSQSGAQGSLTGHKAQHGPCGLQVCWNEMSLTSKI